MTNKYFISCLANKKKNHKNKSYYFIFIKTNPSYTGMLLTCIHMFVRCFCSLLLYALSLSLSLMSVPSQNNHFNSFIIDRYNISMKLFFIFYSNIYKFICLELYKKIILFYSIFFFHKSHFQIK
jgi:hypothetical protein